MNAAVTFCSTSDRADATRPTLPSTRSFPSACVVPSDEADARTALAIARELERADPSARRGSSQCGQTVGEALVIDHSKSLHEIVDFDANAMTVIVQPGVVLDQLNAFLRPHGLWFPVDVSTSAQATIGGMAGQQFLRFALDRVRQHGA